MRSVWVAASLVVTSLAASVALEPGVATACSCAGPAVVGPAIVDTPGSIEGASPDLAQQTTTVPASTTTPTTTASAPLPTRATPPGVPVTAILSATAPAGGGDGRDGGSGWAPALGLGLVVAAVALAVWQMRRVGRWMPPPQDDR